MNFSQLLLAASVVMMATALGAGAVFVFKRIGNTFYATIVSVCAGVMGFSALEMITQSHALAGHRVAFASFLVGLATFCVLDRLLPHAHLALLGSEMPDARRKTALLVGSMTLHNIPEGLAVASAFAASPSLGWLVTLSIALQDIPEGLVVAAPVACQGVPARQCFLWGLFSGLAEFLAAIGGFLFLSTIRTAAPLALGFSAGTMTYVVFFELVPDAIKSENRRLALAAFIAGVAVAYGLSTLLGF
jgi:zinc transporter, ZIP family